MKTHLHLLHAFLMGAVVLGLGAQGLAQEFDEARIFIEYNETDNDLGFHVFLDGEDWETVEIINPNGVSICSVDATGTSAVGYADLGLTELFFEGAEPTLDPPGDPQVILDDLLTRFPEGDYTFVGMVAGGGPLMSVAAFSHVVPAGPEVRVKVDDDEIRIKWNEVTESAATLSPLLPVVPVDIKGYQVIVGSFQVTLPASSRKIKLPKDFVKTLEPGEHDFEVLAIEENNNQTITGGTFVIGEEEEDDD
jgi:hypothetical protein